LLRTIYVALVTVAITIPVSLAVTVIALTRSTSPLIDRLIRFWARTLVRAAGIDLHVENLEALRPGQRYILVSNHYSYFDIPCVLTAIPQPIRFMAKISLFSIPIFGPALRRSGFIPIDRKNRRTAVKSFDMAADRIRKGNTIVVFPEEGRSRHREMREFQRGGFLLALKSEVPIMPIAIDGTYDIYRVGARVITPGRVTVRVGREISTEGLSLRDKERLLNESREQIQAMLFNSAATTSQS
jgi:1-acyl-sn-glycerol-3-phosphate acyltransferase